MDLKTRYRVVSICTDERVDRRILDGARLLSEAGWPTLVVAGPTPNDLADETSYPDVPIFRLTGVHAPACEHFSHGPAEVLLAGQQFPWHRRMLSAVRAFGAEVYIANDLPQLPAAILAARLHGAALVYDAHEYYPSQPFTKAHAAPLEAMERELVRYADALVTVNDSIADLIAMRYACPRPHTVLNCPSRRHAVELRAEDSPLRTFVRARQEQRVLLYQGNLAASRNLEELVDGMALVQSPDIILAFMGKSSAVGEALKERAQQLGLLGTRVHFVPEQSAAELLSWTIGADAGIIPYPHSDLNTWLVSPNKLYEFLAVGLPILASHGPELRRFVGDLGVGVNAHLATPRDFATAIDRFMSGPLDAYRARAREVSARFTWEHEGKQWPAIIDEAVRQAAGRQSAQVAA